MRATDGSGELAVPSYELFSDTEVLNRMALDRMLSGLSTRRYDVGLEPVGSRTEKTATATSRSAVSRRFVARPRPRWRSCGCAGPTTPTPPWPPCGVSIVSLCP